MESAREEEPARREVGHGSTFRLQEVDVVLEAFADETIAVNLGTGRYYSIDLVGAETLSMIIGGHELRAVAAHLAQRYDADAADVEVAVIDYARRLLDEGLIASASDSRPAEALPMPARAQVAFSAPTISVYSDMEDLLLLDPIHDVDETGWPVRADAPVPQPAEPRDPG